MSKLVSHSKAPSEHFYVVKVNFSSLGIRPSVLYNHTLRNQSKILLNIFKNMAYIGMH